MPKKKDYFEIDVKTGAMPKKGGFCAVLMLGKRVRIYNDIHKTKKKALSQARSELKKIRAELSQFGTVFDINKTPH